MNKIVFFIATLATLVGLFFLVSKESATDQVDETVTKTQPITTPVNIPDGMEVATFAGGCFWCVEAVFQETEGIGDVISGYGGGQEVNPVYENVASHATGHRESIQFFYNPTIISYPEILDILWQSIDPTDPGGQFVDRGFAYTTAVFYHSDTQKQQTEQSIADLNNTDRFSGPIVTKVLPFTTFYAAESYHQDYYLNASARYKQYENASGRDGYKSSIWADVQ